MTRPSPRKVALVSVSRADRAMAAAVGAALPAEGVEAVGLVVDDPSGTDTVLEDHGVRTRRLPSRMDGDDSVSLGHRMGALTGAFADAFASERPDIVVLTGDRYETLAAAGAATLSGLVIAHLHGGEVTLGALDDSIRHAVSKLSHLHFCATDRARDRLLRMGEGEDRITVSGAPGLDLLHQVRPLARAEFLQALSWPDPGDFILATWHPETLSADGGRAGLEALLKALDDLKRPVLFTGVNADPGGIEQAARIRCWAGERAHIRLVPSLGPFYVSALAHAVVMAGNSSSGIIEAATFALPVVDVGDRQAGRDRGPNVLHTASEPVMIKDVLHRAIDPAFRSRLSGMTNLYGDGRAGPRIAARLATEPLGGLRLKPFPLQETAP